MRGIPQPLGISRESLVEPDVKPSRSSENDLSGFLALAVKVVFALMSPALSKPRLIA